MATKIAYQLKKNSRSRSIKISIDNTGKIIVSAPKLYPNFLIDSFVQNQAPWIIKQQLRQAKNQVKLGKDEVYLFGEKYPVLTVSDEKIPLGVSVKDGQLFIRSLKNNNQHILLERFFKNTASKYLAQKTQDLAAKMQITYNKIGIRQQSSRWGSCSSRGSLNFNWRLVHYPPAIINYVIIHELAHRQELNHSKKFWQLVAKFDPDYKKHQQALKKRLYN